MRAAADTTSPVSDEVELSAPARVYYVCSPRLSCGSCGSRELISGLISQISKNFKGGGIANPSPSANVCNLLTVRRLTRHGEAFPTSLLSLHPARVMRFVERKQNLPPARALRRALRFRSPYGDSAGMEFPGFGGQ